MEDCYKTTRTLFAFTVLVVAAVVFLCLCPPVSAVKEGTFNKTVAAAAQQVPTSSAPERIVYGKSGLGHDLVCYRFGSAEGAKATILINFELHGYEDLYPADGRVLTQIGGAVADYFKTHASELGDCALYIVPSANPDGLTNGQTNNGPGRCQISLGIDLNRDFSYSFRTYSDSRDHTLSKPFSAPESRALRDLVVRVKPNAVIDCHGWENALIGDPKAAQCFAKSLGIGTQYRFSAQDHGFFSAWASSQGMQGLLVEYPPAAAKNSAKFAQSTADGLVLLAQSLLN